MLRTGAGFGADDGASLLMAFRGLQAESAAQGQAHNSIAKELSTLVADPFDDWARSYKVRSIHNNRLQCLAPYIVTGAHQTKQGYRHRQLAQVVRTGAHGRREAQEPLPE